MRTPGGRDGRVITARRERIGMKIYELAKEAGVDKDTLSDWERGERNPQTSTVERVLSTLDRLEEEMGIDAPPSAQTQPGKMVRFEVTGVYGADALVVEGPVENLAELEAMIDRIMRGGTRRGETPEE